VAAVAVTIVFSTPSFAQDAGSANANTNPQLAAFGALPPAVQRMVLEQVQSLVRDATTPGAVRGYNQFCGRLPGLQICESMEGANVSLGFEGPSVAVNRDRDGHWSSGAGVEGEVPVAPLAGVTGSVIQYFGSGNVETCAGPTFGLPFFGISPQRCEVVDRDRARENREVMAWTQEIARRNAQAAPSSSPAVSPSPTGGRQADDARLVFDENARRQIAQYAYNPPADIVGNVRPTSNGSAPGRTTFTYDQNAPKTEVSGPLSQPSQAPMTSGAPGPNAVGNSATGMTMDQFRASVNQSMQQFRQADAQFRQTSGQQVLPGTGSAAVTGVAAGASAAERQLVFDDNAPRRSTPVQSPQQFAPRNGYDAQGYRADSPRNAYDAQGYRQDSPRNGYDAQGYRQDSPRSVDDVQGYRSDSTRPRYEPQSYRPSSPAPVDPSVPAVTRRAYGTQSQTAALQFPGE
jgi:hypothetical protein